MKNYMKTFMTGETASQFVKTGLVGVVNTVVSFAIFNIGRVVGLNVPLSITAGWIVATGVSYVLNRRWSFQLNDGGENARETGRFAVINLLAWAATLGLMWLAEQWFGPLSRLGENVALLVVSGIILIPKFASYRDIVFRKALDDGKEDDRKESVSETA